MAILNARIPDELQEALRSHCEAAGTTSSAVTRALLSDYLNVPPVALQGPIPEPSEFEPSVVGGQLSDIRVKFTKSERDEIDRQRKAYGLTKTGFIVRATRAQLLNAPMLATEQLETVMQSGAMLSRIGSIVKEIAVNFPTMGSILTQAQIEALADLPKSIEQHKRAVIDLHDSVASRNLLQ